MKSPNQITVPNCGQALQFRRAGFFGRSIRWQRSFPAAAGEFVRHKGIARSREECIFPAWPVLLSTG